MSHNNHNTILWILNYRLRSFVCTLKRGSSTTNTFKSVPKKYWGSVHWVSKGTVSFKCWTVFVQLLMFRHLRILTTCISIKKGFKEKHVYISKSKVLKHFGFSIDTGTWASYWHQYTKMSVLTVALVWLTSALAGADLYMGKLSIVKWNFYKVNIHL